MKWTLPLPESPEDLWQKNATYFTMENKLRRLLKCCFTLYKVPEAKQEEVIGQI